MTNATGILAAFTPKAPVEPTAPTSSQDNFTEGENFKDFLKDAVHSKSAQDSKYDDANRSNDIKARKVDKEQSNTKEQSNAQEESRFLDSDGKEAAIVTQRQKTSNSSPTNEDSALGDEEALVKELESLGLSREQIDALLQAIQSGDATQASAFIQNLIAPELGNLTAKSDTKPSENDINRQSPQSPQAVTDRLQQQKEKAIEIVNKIQVNRAEQGKLANADATKDRVTLQEGGDESKPDFFTQLGLKSDKSAPAKGTEDLIKRADASAKQADIPKGEQAPRITLSSEGGEQKSSQDQSNREPLIDLKIQGSQFSSSQSRDGTVGLKGPEGMKATLEAPPTVIQANGENSSKAVEGVKSFVSETFSGRGPAETKIINQIVDKISIRSNGDQNNIKLRLDPPSLGSVRMNISTVGDSVRTTIVVESQAVKQAIENNISQLKDSMSAQGLDAEQINVTVGGEGFNESANNNDAFAKRDASSKIPFESFLGNEVPETSFTPPENPVLTDFFEDNASLSVVA